MESWFLIQWHSGNTRLIVEADTAEAAFAARIEEEKKELKFFRKRLRQGRFEAIAGRMPVGYFVLCGSPSGARTLFRPDVDHEEDPDGLVELVSSHVSGDEKPHGVYEDLEKACQAFVKTLENRVQTLQKMLASFGDRPDSSVNARSDVLFFRSPIRDFSSSFVSLSPMMGEAKNEETDARGFGPRWGKRDPGFRSRRFN